MVFYSGQEEAERKFCATLGELVVRWNDLEALLQLFLYKTTDARGYRVDVLIANLGNVALTDSIKAIADDYEESLRSHFKHCATYFDVLRTYRNHYVHGPIAFASQGTPPKLIGFTQSQSSKGGVLRLHQGQITIEQLEEFIVWIASLRSYLSDLLTKLYTLPNTFLVSELSMPIIPKKLDVPKINLIKRDR